MGIQYERTKIHWNYFLAIEQDFELISRYVEFTELNNKTFSIELARIIMASTQEVDVIMKGICSLISDENPNNVDEYRVIIKRELPELINEEVFISRFGMRSTPWLNWNEDKNPLWWTANNKIKHQRTNHFEKANLKNAFNAVGALLITNMYYYKLEFEKETGKEISWKRITSRLNSRTQFIQLKDEYYYDNVVV